MQNYLAYSPKSIAEQGVGGFYKGKTTNFIPDVMKKNGRSIFKQYLAKYKARKLAPVTGSYNSYRMVYLTSKVWKY